jgi:hypothetical protein
MQQNQLGGSVTLSVDSLEWANFYRCYLSVDALGFIRHPTAHDQHRSDQTENTARNEPRYQPEEL